MSQNKPHKPLTKLGYALEYIVQMAENVNVKCLRTDCKHNALNDPDRKFFGCTLRSIIIGRSGTCSNYIKHDKEAERKKLLE